MLPITLAVTALCTAWSAFASPVSLSNAERLQRGLPLKAPSRRYEPSTTQHLRARASDLPTGQQVVQVNPFGGLRKREDATYLIYDTVTQRISVGVGLAPSLDDALRIDAIPEGQVAGAMLATIGGQKLYIASTPGDTSDTYVFEATAVSDGGSPIGKNYQTSIWNYASGSLWAEHFSTSTPKAPLYFTLSDSLIGTTDPSSPNLLALSVVALADVQPPVVVAPRNEWYMQVEDTSGTQPGLRYATYNDGQDTFELFSSTDGATVFAIDTAPTNSSRVTISFHLNGTTQLVALKQTVAPYSAYDGAVISMVRTGGSTELNSNLKWPVVTDGWTLESYISGVSGLVGQYTYNDGSSVPVAFAATTHYISGRAITRFAGTSGPATITFVPVLN